MNRTIRLLAKKEWQELIGDRRSLIAAFIYVALGPVLLFMVVSKMLTAADTNVSATVAIDEHQHAALVARHLNLQGHRATVVADEAIATDSYDAHIRLQDKPHSAGVHLFVTGSKHSARSTKLVTTVERSVRAFATQQASQQRFMQGHPQLLPAYTVSSHNSAPMTASQKSILRSLLVFILIAPFVITLAYVSDSLGGERERGALAQIMMQPVSATEVVMSKFIVGVAISLVGTLATLGLGWWLIADLPLHQLGFTLSLDATTLVLTLAWLAPFVAAVVAMQMAIAMTAKSFKESQNYLSMISFAPMITVFLSDRLESLSYAQWLPLLQQQQGLMALFTQQPTDFFALIAAAIISLVIISLSLRAVVHELSSERLAQFV